MARILAGTEVSAPEKIGVTLLCKPKSSVVESIKLRREAFAPYAETLSSIAKAMTKSPRLFVGLLSFEKELFSELRINANGVMTLLTVNDNIDISLRNAF